MTASSVPALTGRRIRQPGIGEVVGRAAPKAGQEWQSLPKFPVPFPFTARRGVANCYQTLEKSGAGDGNRTHDIQLGKLSFYH